MQKITIFLAFGLALICILLANSCQKEVFTTDASDTISFSRDTLRFDTVFTQIGSATRILKAYNPHKKSIRIEKIELEQGSSSKFRINVDGLPGTSFSNVEIAPNDSLYIFAEVTINPDAPLSVSPFVVEDKIKFTTNGNQQSVILEAFGQNANYLPSRFYADSIAGYNCQGDEWVWDDPKPYVIYGVLVLQNCTVRLPAGTRVYVHGGLARVKTDTSTFYYNDGILVFSENARLIAEGTKEKPVIFQGDRLEQEFADEPAQWTGIWLQSKGEHSMTHTIIRNSLVGIRADSAVVLNLDKTQIYNTGSTGLLGIHATIKAKNCLFYSNSGYSIQLEYGGNYQFDHCTAASYNVSGDALRMTNVLCKDQVCEDYEINPLLARFRNCILMGTRKDQITLFDRTEGGSDFDYQLSNCITRVEDLLKPNQYPDFFTYCNPCLNLMASDTVFLNTKEDNYRLDTLASKANGYGVPLMDVDTDLDGKPRDASKPDAGCFEIEF